MREVLCAYEHVQKVRHRRLSKAPRLKKQLWQWRGLGCAFITSPLPTSHCKGSNGSPRPHLAYTTTTCGLDAIEYVRPYVYYCHTFAVTPSFLKTSVWSSESHCNVLHPILGL